MHRGLAGLLVAASCGPSATSRSLPPRSGTTQVRVPIASTAPDEDPSRNQDGPRIETAALRLTWSPDGERAVASCHQNGEKGASLYPTADPHALPQVRDAIAIGPPAWSPDGTRIALPHDRGVTLLDAGGSVVRELAHPGGMQAPSVRWSGDGEHIATYVGGTATEWEIPSDLRVWEVARGRTSRRSIEGPKPVGATHVVSFLPGGDQLAIGAGAIISLFVPPAIGERVTVAGVADKSPGRQLDGHTPRFDPTGRYLAVEETEKVSNPHADEPFSCHTTVYRASDHGRFLRVPGFGAQWSPDGDTLVTQAPDVVIGTSVSDGERLWTVPHQAWLASRAAALSPDGLHLAVLGKDALAIHDAGNGQRLRTLGDRDANASLDWIDARTLQVSTDDRTYTYDIQTGEGRELYALIEDGACLVAEGPPPRAEDGGAPPTPQPRTSLAEVEDAIELELRWAPSGDAVVASCNGAQQAVDLRASEAASLPDVGEPRRVFWNRGSRLALVGDKTLALWSRAKRRVVATRQAAPNTVVHWAPGSSRGLAVTQRAPAQASSHALEVFDGRSGKTVSKSTVPNDAMIAVSWRPNGTQYAVYESRGVHGLSTPSTVTVLDALRGRTVSSFVAKPRSPDAQIQATHRLTWHPRDPVLFTSGGAFAMFNLSYYVADAVSLWNSHTGARLGELSGHTASFDPTGRYLALVHGHPTRSRGGSHLSIRHVKTRRETAEIPGTLLTWGPKGDWVLTGLYPFSSSNAPSAGNVVYRLWRLPDGEPIGRLAARRSYEGMIGVSTLGDTTRIGLVRSESDGLELSVWDLRTLERLGQARLPLDGYREVTWLGDSGVAVVEDRRAHRVVDLLEDEVSTLSGHEQGGGCRLRLDGETGAAAVAALADIVTGKP